MKTLLTNTCLLLSVVVFGILLSTWQSEIESKQREAHGVHSYLGIAYKAESEYFVKSFDRFAAMDTTRGDAIRAELLRFIDSKFIQYRVVCEEETLSQRTAAMCDEIEQSYSNLKRD